jgi:dTDP-glucose 4,6-dehydratase
MSDRKHILITGGAGFIGSHAVRHFVKKYPDYHIINLDKLTYAGNLANLSDIEKIKNYTFIKADIENGDQVEEVFEQYQIDSVIHFAAESHVDRSILDPLSFVKTNVLGTVNLLNAARKKWENTDQNIFYHVSTDEVYGELGEEGYFTEETPYSPRSPYSASKASSDHFVRAYFHTYGLPVVISNCSNNYGPYQFPEKLIPLMIQNIRQGKPLPVYGDGSNIRDWLYVGDHVSAIDLIFHRGEKGETYNIGGDTELKNIELVRTLCKLMDNYMESDLGSSERLIHFVKDRAGHDQRYAIDASKIKNELGWKPETDFNAGLKQTVEWYLENKEWVESVLTGEYTSYYQKQYELR